MSRTRTPLRPLPPQTAPGSQSDATIATTVEHTHKGQTVRTAEHVDRIPVPQPAQTPGAPALIAHLTIGGGLTKNLGNYEAVKINVQATIPVSPNFSPEQRAAIMAALSEAYDVLSPHVESLIQLELNQVTGQQ